MIYASDIETTGLLHNMKAQEYPKLHNFGAICVESGDEILFSQAHNVLEYTPCKDVRGLDKLQEFLDAGHTHVMHNGICFDKPALELLGYDVSKFKVLDSLALSFYLFPKKKKHGLEAWGIEFGIPKPPIVCWQSAPPEEYNWRVMQDCRIQRQLWKLLRDMLAEVYPIVQERKKFIQYMQSKMELQRIQQNNDWELDIKQAVAYSKEWTTIKEERSAALAEVMPLKPVKQVKTRPAKCFKKNRTLSAHGIKWAALCKAAGKNFKTYTGSITIIKEREPGNPNSVPQMKDWLFSLGWVPETFEFKRDKESGETRTIPQVYIPKSGGLLCPSIIKLIKKAPELKRLEGLSVIKHRLGVVNGFLKHVREDGSINAYCQGFTNTLRLKHAGLVNIPGNRSHLGKEIRSLLGFSGRYENLGADLSSLEDRCKHHFQIPLDPEYVKTQMADDYDPHMTIAVAAGLMTMVQYHEHLLYDNTDGKEGVDHGEVRHYGKGTNYSCQYGAGADTVARAAGVNKGIGQILKDAYWEKNWSIKVIAEQLETKKAAGSKWVKNPINNFWYWLKADKDKFSTLCQGLGAYIFDMWCLEINKLCKERYNKEMPLVAQFHDELILKTVRGEYARNKWRELMGEAMTNLNASLGLRRDMDSSVQFGSNYSQIH